ncbi:hypothetical protein DPMN_114550 [Dreissena polymorpha]|uniref:Uncharacterized protein n=1 Tax=Dreissena polymorpha TaxID=45954 RepID=A0A9D4QS45_DREPO|nr:hypothetical protein DPMN_114550 [Dreissena polymorpha]
MILCTCSIHPHGNVSAADQISGMRGNEDDEIYPHNKVQISPRQSDVRISSRGTISTRSRGANISWTYPHDNVQFRLFLRESGVRACDSNNIINREREKDIQ